MKWHEGGGHATRAWWWQEVYKGGVQVLACCVTSPPFYKRMLFLPLTSHCCKDAVSSKPHHRPLRRTRSSFTSVCSSLLRNQRFSQMSTWDKWEPFAAVMVPKNDLKCFSLLSFPVRLFLYFPLALFNFLKFFLFFVQTHETLLKLSQGIIIIIAKHQNPVATAMHYNTLLGNPASIHQMLASSPKLIATIKTFCHKMTGAHVLYTICQWQM